MPAFGNKVEKSFGGSDVIRFRRIDDLLCASDSAVCLPKLTSFSICKRVSPIQQLSLKRNKPGISSIARDLACTRTAAVTYPQTLIIAKEKLVANNGQITRVA
jgi:hypothetical protein